MLRGKDDLRKSKKTGRRGSARQAPDDLTSGVLRARVRHVVLYSIHHRMISVRSNGPIDTLMAAEPPGTTKSLTDGRAEGRYTLNLASLTFLTLMQCYSLLSVRLPLGKVLARKSRRKRMSQSYLTS